MVPFKTPHSQVFKAGDCLAPKHPSEKKQRSRVKLFRKLLSGYHTIHTCLRNMEIQFPGSGVTGESNMLHSNTVPKYILKTISEVLKSIFDGVS